MIERLVISRFRGIRKGVLKDIGKFNLLVGPNNSGKTAVLEALYWLSVCGRKCSFLSEKLTGFPDDSKEKSDDVESKFPSALVPEKRDLLGYQPCPRLWKRHGKAESWDESSGDLQPDGTLNYKIEYLKKDEFLKDFRLIPPQTEEFKDSEKFEINDKKSICLFVLDNPRGMGDMLKYYFPDMYPDVFSYPEDKMRRFAFTWFSDFIYSKKSLGAWGIEGETADADCVLFYDFHTTSEHFKEEFYTEILKLPEMERRLKNYFNNVFPLGDFDVTIQPYPNIKGKVQGIIKQTGMPPIPIDDFGDGARHAFKILAGLTVLVERCKDGKEGIFLWEDPELFMHPDSIYRLLTQVMDMVQDMPIQIFICTQSLEFIALYTKLMKERQKLRDESRVFRLDIDIMDGELVAALSTYSKIKSWLKTGWDLRFWNQTNTIIHYRIDIGNEDDIDD
jgi:AAA15 family ATPase/GTPase